MWDKPQLLNWLANLLYAVTVVLGLYAVLFVVVHLPIFPLRHVEIQGNLNYVTRDQIKLITDKHMQGNFFTLDLNKTKEAFQKLPWAREVSVRRRWPDKLEVTIKEHQAMARWGSLALVNKQGELFHAAIDSDLPIFYANGDFVLEVALNYADFSKTLQSSGLKIEQLSLSPRHAWKLKVVKQTEPKLIISKILPTENPAEKLADTKVKPVEMAIELGRDKPLQRLQRFVSAYKQGLTMSNLQIAYVDLRYPNGFALMQKGANQAAVSLDIKPPVTNAKPMTTKPSPVNKAKPKAVTKVVTKVVNSGVKT